MAEKLASEAEKANIIDANLPALAELCRRFGVLRLDLFGSAAAGRFDAARSFLVEFKPEMREKAISRCARRWNCCSNARAIC